MLDYRGGRTLTALCACTLKIILHNICVCVYTLYALRQCMATDDCGRRLYGRQWTAVARIVSVISLSMRVMARHVLNPTQRNGSPMAISWKTLCDNFFFIIPYIYTYIHIIF